MEKQRKITVSFSLSPEVAQTLFNLKDDRQINLSRFIDKLLFKALNIGGDSKNV